MFRLTIFTVLFLFQYASASYAQTAADFSGSGGGAVILGADMDACDGTKEGAIRYNSSSQCAEYCNGSDWICPSTASSGTCDETPLTFNTAGIYGLAVPQACASLTIEAYGGGGGDNAGGGGGGSVVLDGSTLLVAGGGGGGGGNNDAGGGGGYSVDTIILSAISETALSLIVGEGG